MAQTTGGMTAIYEPGSRGAPSARAALRVTLVAMKTMMQGCAPIFCMALLQGCGGGGGGGKPPVAQEPPPANSRPPLRLDASNYQTVLRVSIGSTLSAFSYVKLGGDMADNLFELPIPGNLSALLCVEGGWTLLNIGDRNLDGFFNVGDYVTQSYDHCKNLGATIDGIIRIELQGVTPKDGGREIEVWVTVANFSVTASGTATGPTGITFSGPARYSHAPAYLQFKIGGASFGSTHVAGTEQASALVVDYLQRQDSGTYSLSFGGNIDSGVFGGTFDFVTSAPFTGTIGQYPSTGRLIAIGGAGSSARLSEEGAAANNAETVLLSVDANGDGSADAAASEFAWTGVVPRQMFDPFVNRVVVRPPAP